MNPDWHEAVVEIQSVLKGAQVKGNKVVVAFPSRNDVAWELAQVREESAGHLLLESGSDHGHAHNQAGRRAGKCLYACLGHGDSLPMSDLPRVRSLLSK